MLTSRLVLLFRVVRFSGAELRKPFDQSGRDGFGEWKSDRAFADLVWSEFIFEGGDQTLASRVQRIMLFPAGEVHDNAPVQLAGRHLIRDHLLGFGQSFTDRSSHLR